MVNLHGGVCSFDEERCGYTVFPNAYSRRSLFLKSQSTRRKAQWTETRDDLGLVHDLPEGTTDCAASWSFSNFPVAARPLGSLKRF